MAPTISPSDAGAVARPTGFKALLLVKSVGVALVIVLVAESLRIFVGTNCHTVVPGQCYRSAQPTANFLANAQRSLGIRTIINLRDSNPGEPWFEEEDQARKDLNIQLVNAGLSSSEQPPKPNFHKFVKAVKNAQPPVLIHCANGNDRSGLGSAVYLLLHTDTSLPVARGQLSLRYGHLSWSKAACLDRILDGYEAWLNKTGKAHSADHFYEWAMTAYEQEKLP